MKTFLLLALTGLAIGFALPTFAQEQKTVDPKVRQEIEAVETAFQDAYKKHDAAAIAALHTQDAVELRTWQGSFFGQEAIQKMYEADFPQHLGKMDNKIVQVIPVNAEICAIINTNVGGNIGHVARVYVFRVSTWKIRMTYVTF
jgi:hypothetical protein